MAKTGNIGPGNTGENGVAQARVELSQRIMMIGQRVDRRKSDTANALAAEIEAIRRIAQANGLYPAASVAHALAMAIGRGERGPLIDGWLAILNDAVGSERSDPAACDAYAAACSVRLAG